MFGAVIGYYAFKLVPGILWGSLVGLLLGLIVEFLLGLPGLHHWLYKRRVLLLVLLELPIAFFGLGPYVYVLINVQPDHHSICCETPLDYGAETYEPVQIETEDGITLAGWYVPPRDQPGPVIVVLHGARADRTGTAWHAGQLIGAGYGVLLYDQRGLGESTGEFVTPGWDGPDLLAVLDYLASRPEVDPQNIGAVGLSGGGYIALHAAYLEPERMYALWLDGIGTQHVEDFPEANTTARRFTTFINRLIIKSGEIVIGRPSPPAFSVILPALTQPRIVMVASGLDALERTTNEKYAGLVGENVKMWLIEDAWHVGGPVVVPEEYSRRMLELFGAEGKN
jgi:pimeloyl-ACP methyl ester carboxylesterase